MRAVCFEESRRADDYVCEVCECGYVNVRERHNVRECVRNDCFV